VLGIQESANPTMKEVFTDADFTRVGYYQSILENAGIQTFMRNMYSHHSLTEMPAGVFFPSLCVVRDDDYPEAMRILQDVHFPTTPTGTDWRCQRCGEEVPAGFETCWNCEEPRQENPNAAEPCDGG